MVELIKSVDLKLTINEHLGVLPTGIPTKRITSSEMLRSVRVLGFTQEHQAAKHPPT